jgi:hypothetical protein
VKRRVKKEYIVKLLTTIFIFSGLLSTMYALYTFRIWKSKANEINSCVPACTRGWCNGSSCCQCNYGDNPGSFGPITCCNPPGNGGCSTYNVSGCNSQPGTPTVPPISTPTVMPLSCTLTVIPSIYTLRSNQAVNLTASVKTYGGAIINRVNFNSNNDLLKVSPQADYTYVYQATVSTLKINKTSTAKVTTTAYLNGTSKTCSGISTITLIK